MDGEERRNTMKSMASVYQTSYPPIECSVGSIFFTWAFFDLAIARKIRAKKWKTLSDCWKICCSPCKRRTALLSPFLFWCQGVRLQQSSIPDARKQIWNWNINDSDLWLPVVNLKGAERCERRKAGLGFPSYWIWILNVKGAIAARICSIGISSSE